MMNKRYYRPKSYGRRLQALVGMKECPGLPFCLHLSAFISNKRETKLIKKHFKYSKALWNNERQLLLT